MTLQDLDNMLQFALKCSDDGYQKVHVDTHVMLELLALATKQLEKEQ